MRKLMTMMTAALVVGFVAAVGPVRAQGPQVRDHLPNYVCMSLNLTEEQLRDFNALPPILANPLPSAAHIGVGSATMIVKNPPQVVNGYEAVLHLNGKPGWIQADKLVPWKNASDPQTRCIPSIMSNGRPGFDYVRLR
jgi:hypothetical protein